MITESMVRAAVGDEFGDGVEYQRPAWSSIRDSLAALDGEARDGGEYAVLVPGRTDTHWFHDFCSSWEVRFLRGRVRFDGERGGAPVPSAVVLMGSIAQPDRLGWWDLRGYMQGELFGAERLSFTRVARKPLDSAPVLAVESVRR